MNGIAVIVTFTAHRRKLGMSLFPLPITTHYYPSTTTTTTATPQKINLCIVFGVQTVIYPVVVVVVVVVFGGSSVGSCLGAVMFYT